MTPSPPPNVSSSSPSFFRSRLILARPFALISPRFLQPISGNTDLATGALERGHTVVNTQPRVRAAVPVASRRIRLSCCATSFASPSSPKHPKNPSEPREIDHRLLQLRSSASVIDFHSTVVATLGGVLHPACDVIDMHAIERAVHRRDARVHAWRPERFRLQPPPASVQSPLAGEKLRNGISMSCSTFYLLTSSPLEPAFAAGELEIELSHGCRCFLLEWRRIAWDPPVIRLKTNRTIRADHERNADKKKNAKKKEAHLTSALRPPPSPRGHATHPTPPPPRIRVWPPSPPLHAARSRGPRCRRYYAPAASCRLLVRARRFPTPSTSSQSPPVRNRRGTSARAVHRASAPLRAESLPPSAGPQSACIRRR
uniref:Uncharacterized protein n=1 Tax=Oryza nivara TaxID=4536 RepID=A0A0E0IRE3_ORYNI